MSDVEKAEALIASLEAKRVAHVEKGVALADERASIAFKVHADADPKARNRLNEINKEIVAHSSENESICAAIKEANVRLVAAQRAAAAERDRVNCVEIKKIADELTAHGQVLDDCLHDLVEAGANLKTCFDKLGQLGISSRRPFSGLRPGPGGAYLLTCRTSALNTTSIIPARSPSSDGTMSAVLPSEAAPSALGISPKRLSRSWTSPRGRSRAGPVHRRAGQKTQQL